MAETHESSKNENNVKTTLNDAEQRTGEAANRIDAKLSGPLAPLEESLDGVFGSKAAYQLPANIKKLLVDIAPWLSLLAGVLGIFSAYGIWRAAHYVSELSNSLNSYAEAFGVSTYTQSPQLSLMFWISIAMTLLFSALAFLAFPGLKAKKKVGWNFMFYSMLANIAYGVVSLFYDGGGAGALLGALIGSAIGLYILFQIRSNYLVKH